MTETWLKQINTGVPVDAYCPVDLETGRIIVGLTYIGEPDGEVVGEFWYDKGEIRARLFDTSTKESEE